MPYIILTQDDGIVFKIVDNEIETKGKLRLHSLNPIYDPFEISTADVKEVWKFVHYICATIPNQPENRFREAQLMHAVEKLQRKVEEIQLKLKL